MWTAGVGHRLRQQRKLRGLTQQQLATRTHFSTSLIKKIEQGTTPASTAFVVSAANALGVTAEQLYGVAAEPALPDASEFGGWERHLALELRTALEAFDDPRPEQPPVALEALSRRVDALAADVCGLRYADVGAALPELLNQLYPLVGSPGRSGELAAGLLHDAYRLAATVAGRFRQSDLAAIASERHRQLAPATGDTNRIAISYYHRSTQHLRHGLYASGLQTLERARQFTDDSPAGRAVAIQLHLRAAIIAARGAQQDTAEAHIGEARSIADQHRPPAAPYYNINADPLNIAVHWCAVPVENYDGAEALRRGDQVRVTDPSQPERVSHHHIDQARASLLHGDRERTLTHLNEARRIAPNNTRTHPQVRETVLALAATDRKTTGSLAGFARWAGITR